jgi:hypothetical protein
MDLLSLFSFRLAVLVPGYLRSLPERGSETYNFLSNHSTQRSACLRQRAHPQFACRKS